MLSKFLASYFLITTLISFSGLASRENAKLGISGAHIQVVGKEAGRYSFQFCEMDMCKDFGRAEGYDTLALENMRSSCNAYSRFSPFAAGVLSTFSFVALSAFSSGTGVMLFAFGQMTAQSMDNPAERQSMRSAKNLLVALPKAQGQYPTSLDEFVNIKNGIAACHRLYESVPLIWLQDCERDLACKRRLAAPLGWNDQRIKATEASHIFFLRNQLELVHKVTPPRP